MKWATFGLVIHCGQIKYKYYHHKIIYTQLFTQNVCEIFGNEDYRLPLNILSPEVCGHVYLDKKNYLNIILTASV